jgi:hypothetical protein
MRYSTKENEGANNQDKRNNRGKEAPTPNHILALLQSRRVSANTHWQPIPSTIFSLYPSASAVPELSDRVLLSLPLIPSSLGL